MRALGARRSAPAPILYSLFSIASLSLTSELAGQNRPCQLEVLNVGRQAVRTQVTPQTENLFAGGDIRLRCRGQNVRMWADSIASYQGQVVQFIGNFRYEDATARVTADFGTYIRSQEKWEARGNVVYRNLQDGSRLEGPSVDYYRKATGFRELEEVFADQRPRLTLPVSERGRAPEPYLVRGDRLRLRGQNLLWAAGSVTIDRSDLRGRGDSLTLITEAREGTGALVGNARIERAAEDSFTLRGRRIDLSMANRELTSVTGRDSARANSRELELTAAAIQLRLAERKVIQTLAWGKNPGPVALAEEYQVRGDSLAIDSPDDVVREFRSFGRAWVGLRPDTAQGERDWLSGDTIRAEFATIAGGRASGTRAAIRRLEAKTGAASFYRVANTNLPGARPSINYSRADRIVLTMIPGDSIKVERVEMSGQVHGIQLEPATGVPDSLRLRPVPPRRP